MVFLDDHLLEGINVAYTAVSQLVEPKLVEVHPAGPVLLLHTGADRERSTVLVT